MQNVVLPGSAAATKAIGEQAAEAYCDLVGTRKEAVLTSSTSARHRFTATKHVLVKPRATVATSTGRLSFVNASLHETAEDARAECSRRLDALSSHPGAKAIVDTIANGDSLSKLFEEDTGSGVLQEPRVASYAHLTCTSCDGHTILVCNNCSGRGKEKCPSYSCLHGHERCIPCGGSGQVAAPPQAHGNGWVNCYTCHGRGDRPCSTCSGRIYINCRTCGSAGQYGCSDCAETGSFTVMQSIEVRFDHRTVLTFSDDLKISSKAAITKWIRDNEDAELLENGPELTLSIKPQHDGRHGTDPAFELVVEGDVLETRTSGTIADIPFEGSVVVLHRHEASFAPFLDPLAAELAAKCEFAAASGLPGSVEAAAGHGPVPIELATAARCRESADTELESATRRLRGAVQKETLARIIAASKRASVRLSEAVLRSAWKLAAIPAALTVAYLIVIDAPWTARLFFYDDVMLFVLCAAAAGVLTVLLRFGVEAFAGSRLRSAAGAGSILLRSRVRTAAPILVWVAMTGTLFLPAVIDGPIRSAAGSIRQSIGLPSSIQIITQLGL